MIRTKRELKRKQRRLALFDLVLARRRPAAMASVLARLEHRRDQLSAELEDYDLLCTQGQPAVRIESLAELRAGLVRQRIASGLSQAALAARLGVAPQQIQQWESGLYSHATFASVLEVATALGIAGRIRLADRSPEA